MTEAGIQRMRHIHPGEFKSIGCEVGMKLGSASCEHLADRHKPARGSGAAKGRRIVRAALQNVSRSVALTPHIRRNTRAKCCCVLKPQPTATSKTRASATRNISFARSTL